MKKFKVVLMSLMLSVSSVTAYGNAAVGIVLGKQRGLSINTDQPIIMPVVSDGYFKVRSHGYGYSPTKLTNKQIESRINSIRNGNIRHFFQSNGQILICTDFSTECADDYRKNDRFLWKTPQQAVKTYVGSHADYSGMALSDKWITIFYTLN